MSTKKDPRVSIGIPVYNGENYLEAAIKSILSQTFEDFELIISDNASTDRTEELCRTYQRQDRRIIYNRNTQNLGASKNYSTVYRMSSGKYFKWAAHDDLCLPEFISKCAEVLDRNPDVVLCYPKTICIDEKGKQLGQWELGNRSDLSSPIPYTRFREALGPNQTFPIWGLIRSKTLKKTSLLGNYPGHDRPLLTSLSLLGRFYELDEALFLCRDHDKRSVYVYNWRDPHRAVFWYDPKLVGKIVFPNWRLFAEHIYGINRSPINISEKLRCYKEIINWFKHNSSDLKNDLYIAAGHIPFFGQIISDIHQKKIKKLESVWYRELGRAEKEIKSTIKRDELFILVDDEKIENEIFTGMKFTRFIERAGKYWGAPPNDVYAIEELEHIIKHGAKYMVFIWPAFWWFEYYTEFSEYLNSYFKCAVKNDHLVMFDLRFGKHERTSGRHLRTNT